MLAHEYLSLAPNALPLGGVLQIVRALGEAGIDVLVPGTMISLPQHQLELGSSVTEKEASGQNHHPRAVRRGVARIGSVSRRVHAEHDFGAGANCGEFLSFNRPAAPVEWLTPFRPALAPDFEVVFLGD